MLLTLDEIKHQCRLESDDTNEDEQLTLYAKAAQRNIENTIGRMLYQSEDEVPEDVLWFAVLEEAEDIKLAMLMLVAHYYANREATTTESLRQIPLGVRELVSPWRVIYPEIEPE